MQLAGGVVRKVNALAARASARVQRYSPPQHDVAPFVAPVPREQRIQVEAVTGERDATPRRYKGRASSRQSAPRVASPAGPRSPRPLQLAPGDRAADAAAASPHTARRVAPHIWSFRLALVTALMCAVLFGWRAVGLLTPAAEAGGGTEAASSAFAEAIAGRVVPVAGPARLLPPTAPWIGQTPYDPAAGLPIHAWLTAAAMKLSGAGDWAGRAVSIVFSAVAGMLLFSILRRTGGTRAGLYALLLFAVAPVSVTLGQQHSGAAAILASQAAAVLALVIWRERTGSPGAGLAWAAAIVTAAIAGALDPGALFLAGPAAYVILYEPAHREEPGRVRGSAVVQRVKETVSRSSRQGKFAGYAAALLGSSALWWAFTQGYHDSFALSPEHGGAAIAGAVSSLLDGATYVQFVGMSIERLLAVSGILFVVAGLLQGTRPPLRHLMHVWLAAGAAHVVFDGSRLPLHEDVLLPLILPVCALAGLGASWAGSLPSRLWSALNRQSDEKGVRYVVSPHTSWLLDVPEARADDGPQSRPQARPALGRAVARRSETQILKLRRAGIIALGHLAVLGVIGYVAVAGSGTTYARMQPSARGVELTEAGAQVAAATPPGALLVIAGPHAAELFAASGRSGWSLTEDEFDLPTLQTLERQGATYLLSADREWLGRHADYRGLITSYAVARLSTTYILFDLTSKPAASDRLYFLESGHTLGGAFRRFWEANGGVTRLGYPISEEVVEPNPLDGIERTMQYFERAVLELHPEHRGTPDEVMLAAVGRWVTRDRDFPRVRSFDSTGERWYFAETGHAVKEAFLRYWQREGGLAVFGYPISEELPEINASDGKVYTVQYFERARLEWHPTHAGTVNEVQLGLIGKQALEMYSR
ncbi:MAG TPA: glycosyltransferase family 39 protein [Chloroflexia bacterium]|nr:glycosyltransferase family 39 protein [Chloroflexia bacterium]